MAVVCLLTPGQPSTNPRLVKEADALIEAGHQVHIVCAHWASWADETDKLLLDSRKLKCTYVGGHPKSDSSKYRLTRLRHRLGRELMRLPIPVCPATWALCRVSPELQKAAEEIKADLYIAHNMGALPAAWSAARRRGAKLGFDAEDFHSGMSPQSEARSAETLLVERLERQILPQCDYVTAAAPLIAEMYALKYSIPTPKTILNVFPLNERPETLRDAGKSSTLSLYWFSQTIGSGRGLEDIVRAMGILKELNIELHLLGDWQPGYTVELAGLVSSVGLPITRIQVHAPAPPSEMVKRAAAYDVGLALEQADSLNRNICLTNKIFTYLLAGNAVIATATRGQQELMREINEAGFCYEVGDIESLASKLRLWCTDRMTLVTARRSAWSHGTKTFNWDREKLKFIQLVEDVLNFPAKQAA